MQVEHASTGHPLADTVARFAWVVPVLPLLGFVLNGWLSLRAAGRPGPSDPSAGGNGHGNGGHHRGNTEGTENGGGGHGGHDDHAAHGGHDHPVRHAAAGLVSIIGPSVLALSFALTLAIFFAMRGAGEGMHVPYVLTLFEWMPTGKLSVDVAFQLDQLSMVMMLIITGIEIGRASCRERV